jgi:hypothetical protein
MTAEEAVQSPAVPYGTSMMLSNKNDPVQVYRNPYRSKATVLIYGISGFERTCRYRLLYTRPSARVTRASYYRFDNAQKGRKH